MPVPTAQVTLLIQNQQTKKHLLANFHIGYFLFFQISSFQRNINIQKQREYVSLNLKGTNRKGFPFSLSFYNNISFKTLFLLCKSNYVSFPGLLMENKNLKKNKTALK